MTFPVVLGVLLFASGVAGLLAAWLHPSPNTALIVKLLTWAPKDHDRLNIALVSLPALALGAFFMLNTQDRSLLALAVCSVVGVGAAITAELRR